MKICNHCNCYYEDTDMYCLKCNRPLQKYDKKDNENENDLLKRSWSKNENLSITKNNIPRIKSKQKLEDQHLPKCPTCGSTNLKKLSFINKAISVGVFGLLSNKINKTWECKNCKSTF